MSRARETKITLPCSRDQKVELARRAQEQGVSVTNYLRRLLDWPLEHQGSRKDLTVEGDTAGSPDCAVSCGLHFNADYPETRESERHDTVLMRAGGH